MRYFFDYLRDFWLFMLEPPWHHSGKDSERYVHWVFWLVGWIWAVVGMMGGALVSPSVVKWAGMVNASHTDWLTIAIAVVTGFLVQLLGWMMLIAVFVADSNELAEIGALVFGLLFVIACLLPLAGVGYGIYRYLTWVGAGQRRVTTAFVGGLMVKTIAIPLIKGIVTGSLFNWFVNWLRGDKKTVATKAKASREP